MICHSAVCRPHAVGNEGVKAVLRKTRKQRMKLELGHDGRHNVASAYKNRGAERSAFLSAWCIPNITSQVSALSTLPFFALEYAFTHDAPYTELRLVLHRRSLNSQFKMKFSTAATLFAAVVLGGSSVLAIPTPVRAPFPVGSSPGRIPQFTHHRPYRLILALSKHESRLPSTHMHLKTLSAKSQSISTSKLVI